MVISKNSTKSSSTSLSAHPPYLQMINEAITSLKDQKGSTQPAIAKFISEKYNPILPPNFTKLLSAQLTKLVKSEKIVKTKNTYKLSTTKESKKKTEVKKAKFVVGVKKLRAGTVESNEKGKKPKMKRLSQVKTPEAMKKRENLKRMCQVKTPEAVIKKNEIKRAKMKRLSQVKTPEAMKKAVYKSTPGPKKVGTKK